MDEAEKFLTSVFNEHVQQLRKLLHCKPNTLEWQILAFQHISSLSTLLTSEDGVKLLNISLDDFQEDYQSLLIGGLLRLLEECNEQNINQLHLGLQLYIRLVREPHLRRYSTKVYQAISGRMLLFAQDVVYYKLIVEIMSVARGECFYTMATELLVKREECGGVVLFLLHTNEGRIAWSKKSRIKPILTAILYGMRRSWTPQYKYVAPIMLEWCKDTIYRNAFNSYLHSYHPNQEHTPYYAWELEEVI